MNTWLKGIVLVLYLSGSLVFVSSTTWAQDPAPGDGWPRLYESAGNRVVVHQPQLDDWQDYRLLSGKAAVSVALKAEDREYYGAINLQAVTEVDSDSRAVLLKGLEVTELTFPGLEESLAKRCRQAVMKTLPVNRSMTLSLDRILAGLEQTAEQAKSVAINLEPPPIYYRDSPAVLVMFMGEPKLEAVQGVSELLYGVNTNWDLLFELGTSNYYLLHGQSWLVTGDLLKGPWKAAASLPDAFGKLPEDDNWKAVKQNIPGSRAAVIPQILVSTQPAELILTEGVPNYSPVAGTQLLYVTNTDSDLFLHSGSGKHYFLTAGRWFQTSKLAGPWSAASEQLPEDFTMIPADHTKAHVLSAVPGTSEAEAAMLLASVPHKATVDRKTTTVTVVYEGDPEFVEINGATSTVYYAVNTPNSIFRVDNRYYCVHNGVWFFSDRASGPWSVASAVPQSIYSIPATHPKYNVTYVYIYDSTPDTVVVGYTSGYSGAYVASTGVIMFGLGYWLGQDDHYDHYHHHSHFYAYGSAARYDYYHGGFYHSARHYGPYGGAAGWAGYNPASGAYYRGGFASGPYGSAFAREAYNPYTNRYAAQARAKTPYGSWGRTVVADGDDWARAGHRSERGETVAGFETSEGAKVIGGYNRWTDRGGVVGKDKNGDLYVGHDGQVYRRDGDNWQKNSGKNWQTVDTAATRSAAQTRTNEVRSQTAAKDFKRPDSSTSNSLKKRENNKVQAGGFSSQTASFTGQSNNLNSEFQKRQRGNTRASTFQQRSDGGGNRLRRR